MAQNSGRTAKRRPGSGRPFKKGQSGNPGGRPRTKLLTDELHKVLEANDGFLARWLLAAVIRMIFEGKVEAAKLIWDRAEGRLAQPIVGTIDIEHRIIEAAEREGVDPKEAVETAKRIIEDARW